MSYMIYALRFGDKRIYVGMTGSLEKRIRQHRKGKIKSTKIEGVLES